MITKNHLQKEEPPVEEPVEEEPPAEELWKKNPCGRKQRGRRTTCGRTCGRRTTYGRACGRRTTCGRTQTSNTTKKEKKNVVLFVVFVVVVATIIGFALSNNDKVDIPNPPYIDENGNVDWDKKFQNEKISNTKIFSWQTMIMIVPTNYLTSRLL